MVSYKNPKERSIGIMKKSAKNYHKGDKSSFERGAVLLVLLLSLSIQTTRAQSPIELGRNNVYAELYVLRHDFNNGPVSLNYEHLFGKKRIRSLRVGIYPDFETVVTIPITFTRITGPARKHHFEYGFGLVYRIERFRGETYHDVPAAMFPVMYRYQSGKGLYFRGGVNVFFSWPILPAPSLSLGYSF